MCFLYFCVFLCCYIYFPLGSLCVFCVFVFFNDSGIIEVLMSFCVFVFCFSWLNRRTLCFLCFFFYNRNLKKGSCVFCLFVFFKPLHPHIAYVFFVFLCFSVLLHIFSFEESMCFLCFLTIVV